VGLAQLQTALLQRFKRAQPIQLLAHTLGWLHLELRPLRRLLLAAAVKALQITVLVAHLEQVLVAVVAVWHIETHTQLLREAPILWWLERKAGQVGL
jgi:hypothetical protein